MLCIPAAQVENETLMGGRRVVDAGRRGSSSSPSYSCRDYASTFTVYVWVLLLLFSSWERYIFFYRFK